VGGDRRRLPEGANQALAHQCGDSWRRARIEHGRVARLDQPGLREHLKGRILLVERRGAERVRECAYDPDRVDHLRRCGAAAVRRGPH